MVIKVRSLNMPLKSMIKKEKQTKIREGKNKKDID
jgi:hypothetical protein